MKEISIDLVDVESLSRCNKGFKYLLKGIDIDIFSKYAWAVPVKTKASNPGKTGELKDLCSLEKGLPQREHLCDFSPVCRCFCRWFAA